jgi:multiple sugar transport system permease protein
MVAVRASSYRRRGLTRAQLGYLLVAPALITIFASVFYPIARTLWLSLHVMKLNQPALGQPFVGLENYVRAVTDPRFWNGLSNTASFSAFSVAGSLVFGLAVALLLNESFKGRAILRSAILIPWAMPAVVVAILWKFMYNPIYGVLNDLMVKAGLFSSYQDWAGSSTTAMLSAIIAEVWRGAPFMTLLLLAGLQIIPHDLYEAAAVDGATWSQRFLHVTLPLLRPTITLALLFRSLEAVRSFDLIFAMTEGGPAQATELLSLYTYRTYFGFLDFGYGAALAVMMVLVSGLLAAVYVRLIGLAQSQ